MVAEYPKRLWWGPGSSLPETAVELAMLRGKALGERVGAVGDRPPAPLPLPLLVTAQETVTEKTVPLRVCRGAGQWSVVRGATGGWEGPIMYHFLYFLVRK